MISIQVLIWHATPTRRFSWFGFGEDFLIRLPEVSLPFRAKTTTTTTTVYIYIYSRLEVLPRHAFRQTERSKRTVHNLEQSCQPLVYLVYGGVGVGWFGRQVYISRVQKRKLNGGKLMIMGLSWLTWALVQLPLIICTQTAFQRRFFLLRVFELSQVRVSRGLISQDTLRMIAHHKITTSRDGYIHVYRRSSLIM